jgi:hypothetical protein
MRGRVVRASTVLGLGLRGDKREDTAGTGVVWSGIGKGRARLYNPAR